MVRRYPVSSHRNMLTLKGLPLTDLSSTSGLQQGEKMDVEMALFSLADGLRRAKDVWAAGVR